MAETRITRLVKQFGAGEAQAMLALTHLTRELGAEEPHVFLKRGLYRSGLDIAGLYETPSYADIQTLNGLMAERGVTWEQVAIAAQPSDKATMDAAFSSIFDGIFNAPGTPFNPIKPKPAPVRYGRTNMPPMLIGIPTISYEGQMRSGDTMIRFTLKGDGYSLMTEMVAFGKHAEQITLAAKDGLAITALITVPEDMGKFPSAKLY